MDIKRRWRQHRHLLLGAKHHSIKLQRHCNKYGMDDLEFDILLICDKWSLIDREQFFIDLMNPWFNVCPTAGSNLGRKMSAESCAKMSRLQRGIPRPWRKGIKASEETREKLRKASSGRHPSTESIEKRAAKMRGRKRSAEAIEKSRLARLGYHPSEETKKKLSVANMGKKPKNCMKPILQISKDGSFIAEWESTAEVRRVLGIMEPNISKVLHGVRRYAGGFIWKFKDI